MGPCPSSFHEANVSLKPKPDVAVQTRARGARLPQHRGQQRVKGTAPPARWRDREYGSILKNEAVCPTTWKSDQISTPSAHGAQCQNPHAGRNGDVLLVKVVQQLQVLREGQGGRELAKAEGRRRRARPLTAVPL